MDRRPLLLASLATAAAVVLPAPALPCTTTGCTLVVRGEVGAVPRGTWRLDATLRYADMDRGLYGAEPVHVTGLEDPPTLRPLVDDATGRLSNNYHQERAQSARIIQADLGRGVTDRLTLVLSLPLYAERSVDHSISEAVHDPNHRDINGAPESARLTTSGIGDLQLNARYLLRRGLIGSLGLQVPTGDDDRIDELGRRADPMLQPGTGALALIAGVSMAGRLGATSVSWSAAAGYQRNTESGRGYRFGDDAYALWTASRPVWHGFAGALTLKAQFVGRSTFHGIPSASTGGRALFVAPGLRWRGPRGVWLFGNVQAPLYQFVNEGQLGSRVIVNTGFSVSR